MIKKILEGIQYFEMDYGSECQLMSKMDILGILWVEGE